ncbi:MAG: caspase family protein [Chitinophagaceae bacterium]|nr:caspase family protein [Chitinophagaceae bacterium]
MSEKKISPSFYSKLIIGGLLIFVLSANHTAVANDGIKPYGTTLVLAAGQYPEAVKKYNPSRVYVSYLMSSSLNKFEGVFLHKDTITNLKKFTDTLGKGMGGFRLIFQSNNNIDSVWELGRQFEIALTAYPLEGDLLKIVNLGSSSKKVDEFIFNYGQKFSDEGNTRGRSDGAETGMLERLLRKYEIYDSYDRNKYAVAAVWVLSVGIDDYGVIKYRTCSSDAQSYIKFFEDQHTRGKSSSVLSSLFHEYVLLDKDATKEAILNALKEISRKATLNDVFIFNFSGCSIVLKNDSPDAGTYFYPYDIEVIDRKNTIRNRNSKDTTNAFRNCISLKLLQEYIQLIPATNQLFISEAGPSDKFKTEFIKTLMQNSPEVASILNKNRIIIVPNKYGWDAVNCLDNNFLKGPINYYITSLDSGNIYDLFKDEFSANQVAFRIKNKAYSCNSFDFDYFDIFFERKFLKDYKEIFGDASGQTRGLGLKTKELRSAANFSGKQYALVVGTNNYKGGWKTLPNAINDARAIKDELAQDYGFEVQLLEDKPMDTIYKAIGEYYRIMNPNDQLIIYFAGHGDEETEFLGDGFIVCADSKPRDMDPARNTYIQYAKLQKMVNNIPSRQILVMLDVCHGGLFNQKILDKRNEADKKAITNRNVRQFLVDQSEFKCRKFLSSVGTDEAFDGKSGDHSPFANLLLQVLRAKGQETNGIVTLSDIYSVLQKNSLNETATLKISPQKDGFGGDNPMSDFILIPVERGVSKE